MEKGDVGVVVHILFMSYVRLVSIKRRVICIVVASIVVFSVNLGYQVCRLLYSIDQIKRNRITSLKLSMCSKPHENPAKARQGQIYLLQTQQVNDSFYS